MIPGPPLAIRSAGSPSDALVVVVKRAFDLPIRTRQIRKSRIQLKWQEPSGKIFNQGLFAAFHGVAALLPDAALGRMDHVVDNPNSLACRDQIAIGDEDAGVAFTHDGELRVIRGSGVDDETFGRNRPRLVKKLVPGRPPTKNSLLGAL